MSFIVALLLEIAIGWAVNALVPTGKSAPILNDEPHADFDDVYDAIGWIDKLMDEGRVAEARDEISRLWDLMHGIDEVAATEARWHIWKASKPPEPA